MKLTKKKAIELHRELWDWLYHHPGNWKGDWPGWKEYGKVAEDCFLCEYVGSNNLTCSKCPLDWGPTDRCCNPFDIENNGYFARWNDALTPKTRKKYAKIIRDLPRKKKNKNQN
jgi:hypothetical protein